MDGPSEIEELRMQIACRHTLEGKPMQDVEWELLNTAVQYLRSVHKAGIGTLDAEDVAVAREYAYYMHNRAAELWEEITARQNELDEETWAKRMADRRA